MLRYSCIFQFRWQRTRTSRWHYDSSRHYNCWWHQTCLPVRWHLERKIQLQKYLSIMGREHSWRYW